MTEPLSTPAGAYLRHPHLHGDLVTFVAENDVWLAPLDGGRAWRLTADHLPVHHPRFSPDGRHIAYTSARDGAPEVHVVPVDGGPSRRLTHWGSGQTQLQGWTADGRPIATTTAGQATLRRTWAYAVPLDGGEPARLPYGPVGGLAFEPDGDRLLLGTVNNREPAWWKRYRGGRAGKLWIGRDEFVRIHEDLDGQLSSPLWVAGADGSRIAFLSDHEGVGELYSSLPDGTGLRRHTTSPDGFYARNAATDGTRVVWHRAGDLWLLADLAEGTEPRRLDVRLAGPRTGRRPRPVHAAHWLETVAPDRTGRASAVVVRGSVHWLTHREGPARVLDETPGVRGRLARVVPGEDGAQGVLWVSDADGEDGLEFAPAVHGAERRRLAAGQLGRVNSLVVSPDGKQAALGVHDGRVLLVTLADGAVHELARSTDGEVSGLVFSPDSAWLAWSRPVPGAGPWSLRQIVLANLATRTVGEATQQRFVDTAPAFTADGRYLAFLSVRNFDPVYDSHVFDLSFPNGCRPYLITLAADTPSPFGPQRAGRPLGGEDEETRGKKGDGEEGAADAPPVTRVDLDGIADRIVPFPVEGGRFGTLKAGKDGVLWTRLPLLGELGDEAASLEDERPRATLERFDLKKRRAEQLVHGLDWFAVSGDGARLAVVDEGELRILPADHKAGDDDETAVDLARLRVTVDPAAEWRQMYAENGRLMRDNFWRPDLSGVDWDGVLERYRPLVERVGSHDDLIDLLWEVHGELATSHAYVMPYGLHTEAARRQGLLGADLVKDGDLWRIARILPGESSDPRARSPLAAPGAAIRPGDAVLAVNGRPVDPVTGPAPLLAGTAGQPVELTVAGKDGTDQRHPVVVPLADEEPLRYHDWVAGRRAETRELSGGRLGYLHIPDMQSAGWAQLHRDLRSEMAKEGVIVDIRENRGGHTSQLVIEKLARRIVGWNVARDITSSQPYPGDAPRGPVVALANEYSGSDGDIVNAAIQALGIGPVVGTRTWGGVIGIDSRYHLVDGTLVTQPKYSFWLENYGWGVENHGVDPDVEVPIAPHEWAAGEDPQLAAGVRIALAALAETPARTAPPLPWT
ncbi:PDZ domain-containing protein [Streptomyces sp. SP17BM10]|uniref:S41 family peptidase n=1 Tax=Streptomyces sp. SP17BM10 TaxID=3002530 RepID=UPI002E76EB0F|nr:S41 family peptidase [Streptomyces sp. SP17BM10]MEE1787931.1 PDZ domain-containing protein [Streptomyces sp. SP17BM10]